MKTETKLSKLEKILDLAKLNGAKEAEVLQMSYTEDPINFENNKLKNLQSNQGCGISIRLIKNNKLGTASSTDPDALESIVKAAIEASEFGPKATFELTQEKINHSSTTTNSILPLEDLVERGTAAIESLKTFHPDLLISGGFDLSIGETNYLNSYGVCGIRTKSIYSAGFYANLVRGEDFLGVYESKSDLENFPDEKKIIASVLEKLNYSKQNVSLQTKKYPVIFTPKAVKSIFVYILSVMLNGKAIEQKISPLINKLGELLFDSKLTLNEDPTIGTKKAGFDDEGMQTQKKVLIKNGTINSFYFDMSSGSRCVPQQTSSGNGFKPGLSGVHTPMLTSLIVTGGSKNNHYKDMVKDIKEGILVDELLGAGQSNVLAGEFSTGIELGFKIENGEIKGRIKNCMIAGNIFEVLKDIKEISGIQEWVGGSSLLPAFLIDGMTVAGEY